MRQRLGVSLTNFAFLFQKSNYYKPHFYDQNRLESLGKETYNASIRSGTQIRTFTLAFSALASQTTTIRFYHLSNIFQFMCFLSKFYSIS